MEKPWSFPVSFHSSMQETKGAESASKKAKEKAHEDYPGGGPRVGWRTWSDAVFEGQDRPGNAGARGPSAGAARGAGYAAGARSNTSGGACRARPCANSEEDSVPSADRLAAGHSLDPAGSAFTARCHAGSTEPGAARPGSGTGPGPRGASGPGGASATTTSQRSNPAGWDALARAFGGDCFE